MQRNKRQRQSDNQKSTQNETQPLLCKQNRIELDEQPKVRVSQELNENGQNQEQAQTQSEKIIISSRYREIQEQLYKNIHFYQTIIDQPREQMCQSLNEIMSYDESLPRLDTKENFVTFIKFITKMIEMADTIVSTDLVSSQQQLDLIHSTIKGFLQLQQLQKQIYMRDSALEPQKNQKRLSNKRYLLNEFKNEYLQCNQLIKEYCSKYNIDQNGFGIQKDQQAFPVFNIEIIENEIKEKQECHLQIENDHIQCDEEEKLIKIENLLVDSLIASNLEVNKDTKIVPDEQDCRVVQNYRKNLNKINLTTPYNNEKEYLENMINYLKADSHQQLALGMNRAIKIGSTINIKNTDDHKLVQKSISKFRHLMSIFNFYNNIEIINMSYTKGLVLSLQVQPILPKQKYEIKWENSKRLIGDQLLYLTDYTFNKIYICQVSNFIQSKAIQNLDSNYGTIKLNIQVFSDNNQIQGELIESITSMVKLKQAIIIEPKEYYGQYFNCIKTIKDMIVKQHKIPFVNNIVHLNKVINPPFFINEDTKYNLDFTPLQQEVEMNKGYTQTLQSDWSRVPTINKLTNSQQKAVKNILTKEISLIQGPPGTGKTYVGAMAIRNLLFNSQVWNPNNNPIVMCCKTNHALDQFLNHIMKFEKSIVRIGTRSKDPEIKKFQLSEIKKGYHVKSASFFSLKQLENKLNLSLSCLSDSIFNSNNFKEIIKVYPAFVQARCKAFLCKYLQNLPELFIKMNDILSDKTSLSLIQKFWWVYTPNTNEMLNDLFYPLIEDLVPKQLQATYKQLIELNVYYMDSLNTDDQKTFYEEKYKTYRESQNYFYKRDGDDKAMDGKTEYEEFQNDQNIWNQIRLLKKTKEQDDEFAEDRDNYIVDDDYDSDEDDDQQNKDFKQDKEKPKRYQFGKNKKETQNNILYFTYFQFINKNYEDWFNKMDVIVRDDEYHQMTYQEEVYIRIYGVIKYSESMRNHLFSKDEITEYFKKLNQYKVEQNFSETQIMKTHKIIAMTLGGACKYSEYLKYLNYQVAIIEEAGEVLENLTIPLLQPTLKQLILIGDHQQLKPSVISFALEKQYNMNVSLFERLVRNNLDYECLSEQMRMCPEFSEYVRLIYNKPNQYLDSQNVKDYIRTVRGLPTNIMFFMHDHQELKLVHTTTKKNEGEANLAISFAKYIIYQKQYKPEQITILTMYVGQSSMIRQLCNQNQILSQVKVCTVDNYQGEENEIIILSLVRSSCNNLGFTKIANRINVSISRAKKGFIVLSHQNLLQTKVSLWNNIFNLAKKNKHIYIKQFERKCSQHQRNLVYSSPQDLNRSTSGGCGQKCTKQNLTCNHVCQMQCHEGECDEFECQVPHKKMFEECGHTNTLRCFQRNMKESELKCMQMVKIKNNHCDHNQLIECYKYKEIQKENPDQKLFDELNRKQCQQICNKKMKCNHKCKQTCHEAQGIKCQLQKCEEFIRETMQCGHNFQGKCNELVLFKCPKKVQEKKLPCGHKRLNEICSDYKRCTEPCIQILDCGHKCIKEKCSEQHSCNKKSTRKLPCGHLYDGNCAEDINKIQCNKISNKPLSCGHGMNFNICSEAHKFQCEEPIIITLSCGHKKWDQCYKKKYELECDQQCQKIIKCGHPCQNKCIEKCTQPQECTFRIDSVKRKECEHKVTGECYLLTKQCMVEVKYKETFKKCYEVQTLNGICKKLLPCGHRCTKRVLDVCMCIEIIKCNNCRDNYYCASKLKHNCDDDFFI